MDNLDKEFQNRFQYEKLPSNDFDVEGLWDSVSDRLDEKPKRRPIFLFFFTGCLFSALLLSGIAIAIWSSMGYQNLSPDSKNKNVNPPSELIVDCNDNKPNVEETRELILEEDSQKAEQQLNITLTDNDLNPQVQGEKDNVIPPANYEVINTIHLATASVNPTTDTLEHIQRLLPTSNVNTKTIDLGLKNFNREPTLISSTLSGVTLKALDLPQVHYTLPQSIFSRTLEETFNEESSAQEEKKTAFEVSFSGGINSTNFTYNQSNNTTISDLKTQAENTDYGQSFGVDLTLITKKGWVFSGGFAYNNAWTVFDYTSNQTEQELRSNQLLKVWVNGMDTLRREYGDALVNINTERIVKHHNQFTQFAIPLSIGYRMQKGKFSYGLNVGTSFNFLIKQSGRGLDEAGELIVAFDNSSTDAPLNQFNIGLSANAMLGYDLSDRLMINVIPSWIFQRHSNGIQQLDIQQLGLNVGLRLRL
jgi:hypothetical protein